MFLFIFESIGTSELILVGIVALIFLGPRKLPEMAKKAGKIMAEFRGTANEFKETWQKEVDFDEETKALDLDTIEAEVKPVARTENGQAKKVDGETPAAPVISEADPSRFEDLLPKAANDAPATEPAESTPDVNDKRNWF
ncbi:MAG: Sec-independent protein translocase protein TatB [Pyrinomonadaceae bacterium]